MARPSGRKSRKCSTHNLQPEYSMQTLWWTVTILLVVVGLIGTLLPLLPGSTLILAGAVVYKLTLDTTGDAISWWTLGGLLVLVVITYVIDFVSGAVGAKYFGATRFGAIGGIIGAIVGLFFGLPGLFLGPLAGVLIGEIIGGKELIHAGKSTWGTLIGTTAGMVAKLAVALAMVAWFALAVMW
jgi:uncharacterized protein YqgC (DUF456 family)